MIVLLQIFLLSAAVIGERIFKIGQYLAKILTRLWRQGVNCFKQLSLID